jgi:peptidoglycan/LPS O-acetylase OafA/YrhL
MRRFKGLEGARCWLAWAVVFSHIILFSGLADHYTKLRYLGHIGEVAVFVFIILSGFVITHLLVESEESYFIFIFRRFIRLYPTYIICLALGIFATLLIYRVLPSEPWGADLPATERLLKNIESSHGLALIAHVFAHVTLLHGAIPSSILYESQYYFLGTAWSLSLEWQFYLVAPLIIAAIQKEKWRIPLATIVVALSLLYQMGVFGAFFLPSFLPGALYLFAIGTLSRLYINKLAGVRPPSLALFILLFGACLPLQGGNLHIAIWLFLLCFACTSIEQKFFSWANIALNSSAANWMGHRSYPIYLVHIPIIYLVIFCSSSFALTYTQMVCAVVVGVPILTMMSADVLHRMVERPCMNFASQLVQRQSAAEVKGAS